MKQVLAVRVGAKKAVGHIVSKRWWPTVDDFMGRLECPPAIRLHAILKSCLQTHPRTER